MFLRKIRLRKISAHIKAKPLHSLALIHNLSLISAVNDDVIVGKQMLLSNVVNVFNVVPF